jgi:hypothetical protein
MPSNKHLYSATMIIAIIEALPLPICAMGWVFALTAQNLVVQFRLDTLAMLGVLLYPAIWLVVFVAVTVLANNGRCREALALTAIPPIVLLPMLVMLPRV